MLWGCIGKQVLFTGRKGIIIFTDRKDLKRDVENQWHVTNTRTLGYGGLTVVATAGNQTLSCSCCSKILHNLRFSSSLS